MNDLGDTRLDPYQNFLAQRRYERAVSLPWTVLVAFTSLLLLIALHAIFTSPLRVNSTSFLNPFFGGVVVAAALTIYGRARESTERWLPLLVLVAMAPWTLLLLEVAADSNRRLIASTADVLLVGLSIGVLAVASFLLLRKLPRRPPSA